jgi:hypothetical protein
VHIEADGRDAEELLKKGSHVENVQKLHGYRRTLIYRPLAPVRAPLEAETHTAAGAQPPNGPAASGGVVEKEKGGEEYVLVIHEFESSVEESGALEGVEKDLKAVAQKEEELRVVVRAFQLVSFEGFGGKTRTPERLG